MCSISMQVLSLIVMVQIFSWGYGTETKKSQPNLIIVMTDEQNYRTLGCYRDQMKTKSQKYIWGEGVKVNTPYIDSLARDGAIYTNFFASSPLCTPARASFVTGLYPNATGASSNKLPLNQDSITFAHILRQNGYETGFFGKWHLNGESKPGFATKESEKFGFKDAKYMYNRGHWKFFNKNKNGNVEAYQWNATTYKRFKKKLNKYYATDFLFDRTYDFLRRKGKGDKPFAVMLSVPDPHNPTTVRKPYDTKYDHMKFKVPKTSVNALYMQPGLPLWSNQNIEEKIFGVRIKDVDPKRASIKLKKLIKSELRQKVLREIFGMISLIDEKMGLILRYLKRTKLEENTIVVFTSDHGDNMGEHLRHDKLVPYDTSAGVPFLIRYPGKIMPGKVVKSAHSGIDFTPTILGLMGIEPSITNTHATRRDNYTLADDRIPVKFDGFDGSAELLDNRMIVDDKSQVRFMTSDYRDSMWAAAVTSQHKLVLSVEDVPWLFDRQSDPDELHNMFVEENDTADQMKESLYAAMTQYKMPLLEATSFFWDMPSCGDSHDSFQFRKKPQWKKKLTQCKEMTEQYCQQQIAQRNCPHSCQVCLSDSEGYLWIKGKLRKCGGLQKKTKQFCKMKATRIFCPYTCGKSYQRDEPEKDTICQNGLNSTKCPKYEYGTKSPKSIKNPKGLKATKDAKSRKSG